ncbi:DUF4153 domain-containing protein [Paraflavitalea sp. CAU 1676]|uniref:DUF4153 domain-containing protein n=1 Tax=Paraflavitalea sp. CAU 1676 TaxID=3032598 RepID=UPI0023DB241F|nr:DUF4153 domain-containing protein [Paraflavitalea sp. CAU 1676]MDF2193144.1 DUF4173 domain-containing protein [Paraflavitalea sp. CAU 1676]
MRNKISQSLLVIAGGVLFSLVFWQEKLGINTVLFDAFILTAIFYLYARARQNAVVRWLLVGHLICLAMIVVHNTVLSKIAFATTLLLIVGFAEYVHRSAWFAGGSVILNIIFCIASFGEHFKPARASGKKRKRLSKVIRFAIFPLILLVVFFFIYFSSNSVFQAIANSIDIYLGKFFHALFDVFSPQRLLFLLFGVYVTGCLLMRSKIDFFVNREKNRNDELQRTRTSWRQRLARPSFQIIEAVMGRFAKGTLALKNENTTGIISLFLLNALLLVINLIDISYLWFDFDYMGEVFLYKMVHDGTELLIVSIVLAMLVVLFFFKGNLNFYKRNKWLRYGAYAWIAQNCILVVSVLLRDYYYIARYGLAYKRIGVLFFLLMVLVGLTTVFIKIWKQRTAYFLFRVNAWAGILLLVLASTVHWDELIASYNIKHKDRVPLDAQFLLTLSDKTLPLLQANMEAFKQRQTTVQENLSDVSGTSWKNGVPYPCDTCFAATIAVRTNAYLEKQEHLSWLSWNYADAVTTRSLRKHPIH